jgi:uncharacterized protein YutE (UPF0331/DUF86 family)
MVRLEHLTSKLEQIRRYAKLLEPFCPCDVASLKLDPERLAACERFTYLICQSSIEAAEMLCKLLGLPRPDTMAESFEQLRLEGILDDSLCASLVSMVGFRNALSHAYDKFNHAILQDVLNNRIADFSRFVDAVVAKQDDLQ